MSFIKQLPGLLALLITFFTFPSFFEGDPNVQYSILGALAVGLGAKALGAGIGAIRRRRRRRRLEGRIKNIREAQLDAARRGSEAAIQSQLQRRGQLLGQQEQQFEDLQRSAAAASGGTQGLNPAAVEAVLRSQAGATTAIDASVADRITQAANLRAQKEAAAITGGERGLAEADIQFGQQGDAAISGLLGSVGQLGAAAFGGLGGLGGGESASTFNPRVGAMFGDQFFGLEDSEKLDLGNPL